MSSELKPHLHLEVGHILFLDIVGYSKLLADEQKELVQELNQIVRETKQFQAAEAEGKLTRLPTGDGMVLVFTDNPEAPVECALEISRKLQSRPDFKLRMGIHSGPVNPVADVNDQANLAGAGINIAQRVMSCGDAGHILLSKHFAEDLEHYAHWRSHLHDVGEFQTKHGAKIRLVSLYTDQLGNAALPAKLKQARTAFRLKSAAVAGLLLIAMLGVGFWTVRRSQEKFVNTTAAIPSKSIAVLPFENRSDDKTNAYFADAIQDEILTRLAKIADLKVISRTSTEQYRSSLANIPAIARELGVAHVLEGSVQRSGGVVRVNVQLIKATNEAHVWADSFDRQVNDLLLVESEIARTIADQLRAKMTGQEEQALAAQPTENADAYDAYLRGLAYRIKPAETGENIRNAQQYFHKAVSIDPNFALAWASLACVNALGYYTSNLEQTSELKEEAGRAADMALKLQPDLGEARLAQGQYYYWCVKDYPAAIRYFEQARQLIPNSSQIFESLAYLARRQGQWDRSEAYFSESERLDPRNPKLMTQHALLYFCRRQLSEALKKTDQILNIVPDDVETLALQADILMAQGDLTRASALTERMHPTAADTYAVGVKAYEAILERRPQKILPWLAEIVTQPDPAATNFRGGLLDLLGRAQDMAGDHAAAVKSWETARAQLEGLLKRQPENALLMENLAPIDVALGDKDSAFAWAERAMRVNPIEKDAIFGPAGLEAVARVAAQAGESDRAIGALEKLLSITYAAPVGPLTPALLRLDPTFDPLRNNPRFQKLAGSATPK